MIRLNKKLNRIEINLTAFPMGRDVSVIITGGDKPHLGALTAASRSLDPETIVFDNHKENFVTEMVAKVMREEYTGNFVVCCGIHLENIEKHEISDILDLCYQMTVELCDELRS
jgi:gallate decarboxylase subunit D